MSPLMKYLLRGLIDRLIQDAVPIVVRKVEEALSTKQEPEVPKEVPEEVSNQSK